MNANMSVKGGVKKLAIVFQIVTVVIGVVVLVFMLWEPHLEGRNANATFFEVYFKDPFLAYVYIASIAFFKGLYNAFKAFGYVRQNKIFTAVTLKALRAIKFSAIIFMVFILGAEMYLFTVQRGKEDDIAGGVAAGLFIIFASAISAGLAGKFERIVQKNIAPTNH